MNNSCLGRDHLKSLSQLKLRMAALKPVSNILIIDDSVSDAKVLSSSLRLMFGHDVQIRHVQTLRDIRAAVRNGWPDLVFLDDCLGHGTTAEVSFNQIRTAGYDGGVIILSGLLTRVRLIELMKLGVDDVIHKDDIDVGRLSESILKVFG